MNPLFLIPARGGSKGLPGKNIKPLNGKPLINYAIDLARCFTTDENICLSTDSEEIIEVAKNNNLSLPFKRPGELASDQAGSHEVMLHALKYYASIGRNYDTLVLLQPTSPLRLKQDVQNALNSFSNNLDMVVSVVESQSNPFLNLYKDNENGLLEKMFPSTYTRRQDAPVSYEYNGAVYVINVKALHVKKIGDFKNVKKTVMGDLNSVDIDKHMDFYWAEFLLANKHVQLDY